jgi:hypothetical protein
LFDRNGRLASRYGGPDRGVDVRELRIPIRMFAAFPRLSVGLATVFQIAQQVRHDALAGLKTFL